MVAPTVVPVVACTYCGGVEAPGWFSANGLWIAVGALVLVGVVVGLLGLLRADWTGRSGALRIGLGLAVLLPVAAAVAMAGDTRVDVAVEGRAPFDADAWSVSCDTFQAPADDDVLQEAFHDACADATRPARWASIVLAVAALGLAADGTRRLLAGRASASLAASPAQPSPVA